MLLSIVVSVKDSDENYSSCIAKLLTALATSFVISILLLTALPSLISYPVKVLTFSAYPLYMMIIVRKRYVSIRGLNERHFSFGRIARFRQHPID